MTECEGKEHRVVGMIGDDLTVQTAWMDIPHGEATGIEIALELQRNWAHTDIECRDAEVG